MFQTYGQYWLDEEGCECGPFVIEPISTDSTNKNVLVRELKLTYEPQVCLLVTSLLLSHIPSTHQTGQENKSVSSMLIGNNVKT